MRPGYAYLLRIRLKSMRDLMAAILLIRGEYVVLGRGELPEHNAVTIITATPIEAGDQEVLGIIPFENI